MALGEFGMFSWKSKAAQDEQQEEYARWAFPHGQTQRDNLEKLLGEMFPKDRASATLISFLTCKELFEAAFKECRSLYNAIGAVRKAQKRYRHILKEKDLPMYLALVIADVGVDERCEYADADEIRDIARKLGWVGAKWTTA